MSEALQRALRTIAETPRAVTYTDDNMDDKTTRELREVSELVLVLARLLAGKTVHQAFGAPGDWGYGTPIGHALAHLYSENGGNEILCNKA